MTGLIDVGGGMRDIYGAGVMDCFLDNTVRFDICIGVSAGSANIASFLAGQKGRNYRFFAEYSSRREYMSFHEYIKSGSYMNLDYIYSELSNSGCEDPIDYDVLANSESEFLVVVTDAETGNAEYFSKSEISKDDLWLFKASCSIPLVCKPYEHEGKTYFDGGIADPIPVEKAFDLGCDRVVVIIPRPVARKKQVSTSIAHMMLRDYPEVLKKMDERAAIYNRKLDILEDYIKTGRVILISPDSDKGLNMVTRDKEKLDAYYKKGYSDALNVIYKI